MGENRKRKTQYQFQDRFENMGLQVADGRPMTLCSETWNKLQLDGSQNKLSFKIIFTKYIILPDNSQNRLASKSIHKIMLFSFFLNGLVHNICLPSFSSVRHNILLSGKLLFTWLIYQLKTIKMQHPYFEMLKIRSWILPFCSLRVHCVLLCKQ